MSLEIGEYVEEGSFETLELESVLRHVLEPGVARRVAHLSPRAVTSRKADGKLSDLLGHKLVLLRGVANSAGKLTADEVVGHVRRGGRLAAARSWCPRTRSITLGLMDVGEVVWGLYDSGDGEPRSGLPGSSYRLVCR